MYVQSIRLLNEGGAGCSPHAGKGLQPRLWSRSNDRASVNWCGLPALCSASTWTHLCSVRVPHSPGSIRRHSAAPNFFDRELADSVADCRLMRRHLPAGWYCIYAPFSSSPHHRLFFTFAHLARFLSSHRDMSSRALSKAVRIPLSQSARSQFHTTAAKMTVSHADMFKNGTTANGMKGPLFASQQSLPRLPVPSVEQTLTKWLQSTLPHQPSQEAKSQTEKAVKEALSGSDAETIKKLQERLLARKDAKENWLSEWWNEVAYMGYRDPIIPYVNYFYKHQDDRRRKDNVSRSSALIKGLLAFRRLVESEQLAPEKTKTGALCSASYPWLFNSVRIPQTPVDYAVKYPANQHNHLVVLRNGKYWQFSLVGSDGQELSEKEIQSQLKRILQDPEASKQDEFPIGALTGENRDKWATARDALIKISPENKKALNAIESSVIVLCLDNFSPVTVEEGAWQLWQGNGARNRFFDKQELVVFDNGSSGYNGEHSTMDGTPTLRMNDFVLAALDAGKIDMGSSNRTDLPAPTRIQFQLNESVKQSITSALHDFQALIGKHDMEVLDFQGYGKEAIKKFKCSPDAWAQMCIQLAYYKMYGKPCPTYESAQTRKFLLGRTEVIRSASVQSKAFCEAMENPDASVSPSDFDSPA